MTERSDGTTTLLSRARRPRRRKTRAARSSRCKTRTVALLLCGPAVAPPPELEAGFTFAGTELGATTPDRRDPRVAVASLVGSEGTGSALPAGGARYWSWFTRLYGCGRPVATAEQRDDEEKDRARHGGRKNAPWRVRALRRTPGSKRPCQADGLVSHPCLRIHWGRSLGGAARLIAAPPGERGTPRSPAPPSRLTSAVDSQRLARS